MGKDIKLDVLKIAGASFFIGVNLTNMIALNGFYSVAAFFGACCCALYAAFKVEHLLDDFEENYERGALDCMSRWRKIRKDIKDLEND